MLLRSAKNADLEAIHTLAQESGFGLTTLPKDRTLLMQRLEHATNSWQSLRRIPGHAYYLFVLEDPRTSQIIGTSAIEAHTGGNSPFYSYKISKRIKISQLNNQMKRQENDILYLVNDYEGHTELCTLYLKPNYRKTGCGALLSRARFLFLAQHPTLFSQTIIAEMRGVTNALGSSPFWDALGYQFFHLSFLEADQMTLSSNKQFIADLMPEYPIYVELLPPKAREVIGKPHADTLPAMELLKREGFYYNRYIDIFDGGPVLEAPLTQIKTCQSTRSITFHRAINNPSGPKYLIANQSGSFRATTGQVCIDKSHQTCMLDIKTANLLQLSTGDQVSIALI